MSDSQSSPVAMCLLPIAERWLYLPGSLRIVAHLLESPTPLDDQQLSDARDGPDVNKACDGPTISGRRTSSKANSRTRLDNGCCNASWRIRSRYIGFMIGATSGTEVGQTKTSMSVREQRIASHSHCFFYQAASNITRRNETSLDGEKHNKVRI